MWLSLLLLIRKLWKEVITMDDALAEYIREKVQESLGHSFASYSFLDVIDDTEISDDEREWAKEHLDWTVVILSG